MDKLAAAQSKAEWLALANQIIHADDFDDEPPLEGKAPNKKPAVSKKKPAAPRGHKALKREKVPSTSTAPPSDTTTTARTSEDIENTAPMKRPRKVRSKEEVEEEKKHKEINKISREINAAKNSKCEIYLNCHCSNLVLSLNENLRDNLTSLFSERKILDQLKFENMDWPKIYWQKKRIMAVMEENEVRRVENMEMQFSFIVVLDGETFKSLVREDKCVDCARRLVDEHVSAAECANHATLAILGAHGVPDSKLTQMAMRLWETVSVQLRVCRETLDLCFLIAQTHRALAKMEKKQEIGADALHAAVEKGVREGESDELVADWWSRMLLQLYRVPEECRRAILERWPSPFALMADADATSAGEAMQRIADLPCGNGRRVGPAIAQKLFLLVTSEDGAEVLDRPNLTG